MMKKMTAVILSFILAIMIAAPALSISVYAVDTDTQDGAPVLGDADGDGIVTIVDATRIQRYLAELSIIEDRLLKAADIDGDGDVTIMDATGIQRWIAGFDVAYPIGEIQETIPPTDPPTEEPTEEGIIVVTLTEGTDYASQNYSVLNAALARAREGHSLTVKIAGTGVYYVGSTRAALRIGSATTLDLNGSTLMRYDEMGNLFQNTSASGGSDESTGYDLSHDITLMNGTLDGYGGTTDAVNLCNFGHASGITLKNITFRHTGDAHLVEFTGCRDCNVIGCTFTGYRGGKDQPIEALQFDICDNTVAGSWNGVYASDGTVCRNMTVEDCTFLDYPSGVGNHKGIAGNHNIGIIIRNNTFSNTLASTQPAIWSYDFDDSIISGNTITGTYGYGVKVSAGDNVTVSNNEIKLGGTGINVTVANSYTQGKNYVITSENTSACRITGNTVKSTGSNIGFSAYSGSDVADFSSNTVTAESEAAATFSSKSTVTNISGNKLTSGSSYGLLIATGAVVKNITGNTINAVNHGIQISSDSTVSNIKNNPGITSKSGSGIYITSATASTISGNTVKNCGVSGIMVTSSGKVSAITSNTVTGCSEYGIRVNNTSITVTLSKNTCTGNKLGATKISARTA